MKKLVIILSVIILGFAGVIWFSNKNKTGDGERDYSQYRLATIKDMATELEEDEEFDFSSIDTNKIIEASAQSGGLPENTEGEGELLIFEYADYECSHCAEWSTVAEKIVKDYQGKVKLVFRGFVLDYNANSVMAAAAANAAAIQGYWSEIKTIIFANQSVWAYLKSAKLKAEFESYFMSASNGKGDLEKFRKDMESEAVAKKIAFDYQLGEKIQLTGTPTFIIDGESVEPNKLRSTIEDKLK